MLSFRATRSAGPGGQNVNKVATRVELTLDLEAARTVLGDAGVSRVRRLLASRLDAHGDLRVASGRTRSRARNLELACARMEELLREALAQPRARRETRPTAASRRRRAQEKRARSEKKKLRRPPPQE